MVNIELKRNTQKWMVAKLSLVLHPNLLRMKSFTRIFLAVSMILSISFAYTQKPLPNGKVKDMEGKVVDLSTLTNGKVTLVSFWATWCGPCKKELDTYNPLYPEWTKKYGAQFLAVSIDNIRDQAKIKPLVAQKKWAYTVLLDSNGDLQRKLGFNSIPQLYLLNKKGQIVYEANGYNPGAEKELESKMAGLAKS